MRICTTYVLLLNLKVESVPCSWTPAGLAYWVRKPALVTGLVLAEGTLQSWLCRGTREVNTLNKMLNPHGHFLK